MVLNLLNIFSLIIALFDKIDEMTIELESKKPNNSISTALLTTTSPSFHQTVNLTNLTKCYEICNPISQLPPQNVNTILTTIVSTIATTAIPILLTTLNSSKSLQGVGELRLNKTTVSSSPFDYITQTGSETDAFANSFQTTTNEYSSDFVTSYFSNATEPVDNSTIFDQFVDDFVIDDLLQYLNGSENETVLMENLTSTTIFDLELKNEPEERTNLLEEFHNRLYYYLNFILNKNEFFNETYLDNATELFEDFKTTMLPLFEDTDSSTVDEELSTFYKTVMDSVTTTLNELTTTEATTDSVIEPVCTTNCGSSSESFSTSTSIDDNVLNKMESDLKASDYQNRSRLRSLCWETMFGQEVVKITVLDLVMTIVATLGIDFFRGVFVRYMNRCWCWDLENKFPEYGEFKVAENILHLVNNQGMVWMGMFFSPGLVLLNVIKLYILMYLRSWAVLTCNVPHAVIFRASRSNNFYLALLLTMLFLCVLPVGYAVVWVKPSWHCGPFSRYKRIFHIFRDTVKEIVPENLHNALDYTVSPGIVIPLLVLLILIIYYLISLTNSLREANNDLKIQLRRERTEERRKMFQIADRRRRGGSNGSGEMDSTPYSKWKRLLTNLPSAKSFDDTPKEAEENKEQPDAQKDSSSNAFAKFIKRALRKPSTTSEEENPDDATDNEQPDSLPDDVLSSIEGSKTPRRRSSSKGSFKVIQNFQDTVNLALKQKRSQPAELVQKISPEASDAKRVHIVDVTPDVHRNAGKTRKFRDTIDLKKHQEWRHRRRHSPTTPPAVSENREDSLLSNWSDNIPVITISKTESAECILEQTKATAKKESPEPIKKDVETKEKSSSSDTLVADEHFKPTIKHVLKKSDIVIEKENVILTGDIIDVDKKTEEEKNESTGNDSSLPTSDSNKTESSSDYRDQS